MRQHCLHFAAYTTFRDLAFPFSVLTVHPDFSFVSDAALAKFRSSDAALGVGVMFLEESTFGPWRAWVNISFSERFLRKATIGGSGNVDVRCENCTVNRE